MEDHIEEQHQLTKEFKAGVLDQVSLYRNSGGEHYEAMALALLDTARQLCGSEEGFNDALELSKLTHAPMIDIDFSA